MFSERAKKFASLFDEATDNANFTEIERLITEVLCFIQDEDDASKAYLYYCIGTVLGVMSDLNRESGDASVREQLFYLRKSLEYSASLKEQHSSILLAQIHTNLGNALSNCGRRIAALEQYKLALTYVKHFGMALGNMGMAYIYHAAFLEDLGHRHYLHHFAYRLLKEAIESNDKSIYPAAQEAFRIAVGNYSEEYVSNFLEKPLNIRQYKYDQADELAYRIWAVKEGVFLNPLNDLPIVELCFAADTIQLPSITADIEDKPIYHGIFNQLKQEYIYARYHYYESTLAIERVHFADKETYLSKLHDYAQYSIRIEALKTAYKTLYSLFDKIAFLLNYYFSMEMNDRDISFHNIWDPKKKKTNGLVYENNYGLRALYWISRDFFLDGNDSANPHAKRLSDIRNALEHRYAKIVIFDEARLSNAHDDNVVVRISEEDLMAETLTLMKIVREAVIYVVQAVRIEESHRNETRIGTNDCIQVKIGIFNDEMKL